MFDDERTHAGRGLDLDVLLNTEQPKELKAIIVGTWMTYAVLMDLHVGNEVLYPLDDLVDVSAHNRLLGFEINVFENREA